MTFLTRLMEAFPADDFTTSRMTDHAVQSSAPLLEDVASEAGQFERSFLARLTVSSCSAHEAAFVTLKPPCSTRTTSDAKKET
jgi:hypothetical protein